MTFRSAVLFSLFVSVFAKVALVQEHSFLNRRHSSDSQEQWNVFGLFGSEAAKALQAKEQIEFIHIPKNGGTAVEDAGHHSGEFAWGRFAQRWQSEKKVTLSDHEQCYAWHVPPSLLQTNPNPYENKTNICIKRHPYDRAISQYMYAKGKKCQTEKAEGLNQFLQDKLHKVQAGKIYEMDCHFLPQTTYMFKADGQPWCSYTFDMMDLSEHFNELMEKHGAETRLSAKPASHWSYCPDVTPAMLTQETRDLIDTIYAEDFKKLDYSTTEGWDEPTGY